LTSERKESQSLEGRVVLFFSKGKDWLKGSPRNFLGEKRKGGGGPAIGVYEKNTVTKNGEAAR